MNIFLVKSTGFPKGGASAQHVRLMVKGFRESGAPSWLITTKTIEKGARRYGHVPGVPYVHMSAGPDWCSDIIASCRVACMFLKRKLHGKKDAVLSGNRSLFHDFPLVFTCWIFRIPFFVWAVELESLIEGDVSGLSRKTRFMLNGIRLYEKLVPKMARGYAVISTRLYEHYRKVLPENRIMITPIIVDPSQSPVSSAQPPVPSAQFPIPHPSPQNPSTLQPFHPSTFQPFHLVYSGTFGAKDGVPETIEAFIAAAKEIPDLELVLTGAPTAPEARRIEAAARARVREAGLEHRVRFAGFVSFQELMDIMNRANILLACRTNSQYANYGFPWKLAEYLMTGKPVIATDVSDISLYLKRDEEIYVIPPDDAEAQAAKIIEIHADYPRACAVAEAGRCKAMEVFDYLNEDRKVVEFMERLAGY